MRKVFLLFLFVFGVGLQAQNEFRVSLDTNQIKIGESIEASIYASIPLNSNYQWPILEDSLSAITLIQSSSIDSTIKEDQLILRQSLSFTSFDSNEVFFPSLEIKFDEQSLSSDSISIKVFFPEIKEDQDYFDIKAPRTIAFDYWLLLWYSLAALGLGLLIYLIVRYWPKKQKKEAEIPIELDPRSPSQWALDQLRDLERKELWQQDEIKQYYSELIDILRHFLERQYGIKAMESTAEELIEKLENRVTSAALMTELRKSLRLSTLVKYARERGMASEHEQALNSIREFVNQHANSEDDV